MYSNNVLKYQEPKKILNACTKKSLETYRMHLVQACQQENQFSEGKREYSISPVSKNIAI